ncbi:unnamed protein product [Oikopleura dioica]|uniref:Agrin n=1 Tax=Oikopleura dioica TaxID=34765 RepID=E4YDJ9_OIKDI|nr:unnamed protein product [Oikopleura dioica]
MHAPAFCIYEKSNQIIAACEPVVKAFIECEFVEDKCARTSCSFGAVCDPTSGKCECVDMRCERKEVTAVCGSDGITYLNECELEHAQCREQQLVSLQYHGLCRDVQVAEIECRRDNECQNGSICNVGICRCPACDDDAPADENINELAVEHGGICRVCNPIYWDGVATRNSRYCEGSCLECENEPFSTIVCATKGSFRRVFASECLAKCSMGDDVDLTVGGCYEPPCEECRDKECKLFGTEWKCNCPLCPAENNPVCGSDGVTYNSLCVMKRTNCEFGSGIELVSSGKCPEKGEEEDKTCEGCFFGAYCERGRCKCDYNCKSIDRPVCGDNNIDFKNECFLREFECQIQQPFDIVKSGHCSVENDQKNCPIYTAGVERTVDGVECHCPECDHHFGDSAVCGSDGKLYDSRCELRSQACHFNEQIFEVPLDHCGLEIEGSGGGEVCKFGGVDASDRFDDDEEFSRQIYCRCNWHCEDDGAQVVAEGVVFDNLCKYYRDGNCKNQRELVITKSNCHCNNPGAYDREGPCDHAEGCLCKPGYKGKHCEDCELNYYQLNGRCMQCSCSQQGSRGALCDENGQCFCKAGFIGQKCDIKVEQDRDQCQACSSPEIESGAICGDDHRIYGSRCAMRRLHCNKKPENQPEAVKYFKQCLFSGYPQIEIDEDESSEESEIMEDIIMLPVLPPTQKPTDEPEGSGGYVDPQFSTCDDEECGDNSISLSEAKLPQDSSIDFDSIRYDVVLTLKNNMDWNDKERIEKDLSAVFASELSEINLKSAVIDKIEDKSAILSIEISPDKPYLEAKINSHLQENIDRSSFSQFNIVHGQWFGGESFERYSFEKCDTTYEFEIKFKFRTRDPNGVIFWAGSPDTLDKRLALTIKDSKLELSFAKNEPFRYKKAVDDNVWHTVELKFNRGGITLILDHIPRPEYIATGKKDSRELDLSNIYIGGIPKDQELDILSSLEINKGLTGCFQMIGGSAMKSGVSENKDYPIKSVYSYGIAKCDGRSPCQNNLNECDKDDSCVEWDSLRFCEASKGPHRLQGVKMNGSR